MASRRRDLGELSPRLLELSAKTISIEPYVVTEKIVIRQTRKRREELHAAWLDIGRCQTKLTAMVKRANVPPPEPPGDDATPEQIATHDAALAEWNSAMEAIEAESTQVNSEVKDATERYERAFFGDAYDDIMELSQDWELDFWDAFKADVNDYFMKGVNPPPDGISENGEVIDLEEAGKAQSSST